jgi:hypothetical protein
MMRNRVRDICVLFAVKGKLRSCEIFAIASSGKKGMLWVIAWRVALD